MTDYADLVFEVEVPKPMRIVGPKNKTLFILHAPTQAQQRAVEKAELMRDVHQAVLGEQYDEIVAYFDTQPMQRWSEFWDRYFIHFYGRGASEAPGKSQDSSDSSESTGEQ